MPATSSLGFSTCYIDPAMVPLSSWPVTLHIPEYFLNGTLCNVVNATLAEI